ncbi:MAG: YceI family protein [Pseudomonadota bacterium]
MRPTIDFHTLRRAGLCFGLCVALAATLVGCAPSAPKPMAPAGDAAPDLQDDYYRAARAKGERILQIDSQASVIRVLVRRGGRLARLGHDHVVASRHVQGQVAPDAGRADFRFRLDHMTVDEQALRQQAGFTTQPSEEAIAGTRNNMLTKVLDAERYPFVSVQARGAAIDGPLSVSITLHGVTRTMAIPVQITRGAQASMTVSGAVSVKQTDFGLVPFSVLGGAIAVEDQIDLQFSIVAR